jgi:hypothetical protein
MENGAKLFQEDDGTVWDSDLKRVEYNPETFEVLRVCKDTDDTPKVNAEKEKRIAREKLYDRYMQKTRKELCREYRMPFVVKQKKADLVDKILDKQGFKCAGIYRKEGVQ